MGGITKTHTTHAEELEFITDCETWKTDFFQVNLWWLLLFVVRSLSRQTCETFPNDEDVLFGWNY